MLSLIVHILRAAVKVIALVSLIGSFGKMIGTQKDEALSHENKVEQMLCDMAYMLVMAMILCA